jgi:uncharacterized protein (TIGR00369 family)
MVQKGFYEVLRAHFTEAIPHSRECGMVVDQLDAQGALAHLPYRPDWLGDIERGVLHTGIITTLIDTVSGLAAVAAIGRFDAIATLDLRMDYLRPAVPDKTLHTRAECYRLTRSIAFVRASAWQDAEREPVAVSQSTFMRSSRQPRAAKSRE